MNIEKLREIGNKATPGPWGTENSDVNGIVYLKPNVKQGLEPVICTLGHELPLAERIFNKKLILAAREHWEALMALVDAANRMGDAPGGVAQTGPEWCKAYSDMFTALDKLGLSE
jgi:hypothetical protein